MASPAGLWRRLLTSPGAAGPRRLGMPWPPAARVSAAPLAPRSVFSRGAGEHAVPLPPLELPACARAPATPTIAVAMSGGVDSSVTAWLLKEAGYNIFGIHMQNWDEEEEKGMHAEVSGHCSSAQDLADARRTCDALGVELKLVRFVREYWTDVFDPMLRDYMAGATPNPDIACNREIKFSSLLEQAHVLGADLLATGHYARLEYTPQDEAARLLEARDLSKDQSYFLSSVPGSAFKKVMFPLGSLLKEEVRAIAAAAKLPAATKRESMGLCFVGRRRFDHFLSNYLPDVGPRAELSAHASASCASSHCGQFLCVETRRALGPHKGLHLYTIGQGAKISGAAVKWFVAAKEGSNILVAPGSEHSSLYTTSLLAGPVHWIAGHAPCAEAEDRNCTDTMQDGFGADALPSPPSRESADRMAEGAAALGGLEADTTAWIACQARIRHLQPLSRCRVMLSQVPNHLSHLAGIDHSYHLSPWGLERASELVAEGRRLIEVVFDMPQRAVAPGQVVVFYSKGVCLGSAPILAPGPSLASMSDPNQCRQTASLKCSTDASSF